MSNRISMFKTFLAHNFMSMKMKKKVTEQFRVKAVSSTACVQTLGLSFTSSVTFGRLFNLSGFSYL